MLIVGGSYQFALRETTLTFGVGVNEEHFTFIIAMSS